MARHRARKQRLPQQPVTTTIENLAHDGRGIARIDGKTVFIDGALPGETVQFRYRKKSRRYDEGSVVEVVANSSADRVIAKCQHFGICGGCSVMHLQPAAQIALKQATLAEQLQHFGQLAPEAWLAPLTGPIWGYRAKAWLAVKHVPKKDRVLVGFREKGSPFVALLKQCEVLDPRVGLRLAELGELIAGLAAHNRIAQIEVAMDTDHVALVFRNLDPLSAADQNKLIAYGQANNLWIYLQAGGPETITPIWPADPQLCYSPEPGLSLDFTPSNFTQVNSKINQQMIQRVIELLELEPSDRILDLFCGLGNFTLPLAKRVEQVVGVEGDAILVKQAQANAANNQLSNLLFAQADLTQTQLSDQPWAQQGFNKIVLDPPRSGAFEVLHQLAALGAECLVYVSCDPATLARDAGELVNKYDYRLVKTGVMDMFPHTRHIEAIALFIKQ